MQYSSKVTPLIPLHTATIHDKSGQAEITKFGKIAGSLKEQVVYVINHV